MKKLSFCTGFAIFVVSVFLACTPDNPDIHDLPDDSLRCDTLILSVIDTIGVLEGLSEEIFGDIGDASYNLSGEIAVLDRMTGFISFFSSEGEFITRIGGLGESPSEFHWATSFAPMYDGKLIVSDYSGRRLVVFDDSFSYEREIQDFPNSVPSGINPLPDGTFTGRDMELLQSEDGGIEGENFIRRWSPDSTGSILTYTSSPMFVTLLDDGIDVKPASFLTATSIDGSVYCSVSSDSIFEVTGYTADGVVFLQISEPWERVAKMQSEIDAEAMPTALQTDDDGSRPVRVEAEVDLFHKAVAGLSVDDIRQIWVRVGSESIPTFRVYDSAGNLCFVARCPELQDIGRQIRFQMRHGGIVAWDRSPEDYPKIYLIGAQ